MTTPGSWLESSWKSQFPTWGGSPGMGNALTGAAALAQDHLGGSFNTDLDKSLCHTWVLLAAASNLLGGNLQPSVGSMSASVRSLVNSTSFGAALVCENTSVRNQLLAKINTTAPTAWIHLFPPEYARHLRSEYTANGWGYTNHQYAEPSCLAEMDGRAARSYCGMRRAAQVANGRKLDLGSQPADSFCAGMWARLAARYASCHRSAWPPVTAKPA